MSQQVHFDLTNSFQPEPSHTMEIAGVAIGILPLVSLFENAITCFTRVKMAKSFGPDLQFFMVRLEVLHLRLTRWGEALGLNKPTKANGAPSTSLPTSDQRLATKVLEQIKTRFEDAAKVVQDVDIGEDLAAITADLGDKRTLVEGLRTMSIKRHPRASTMTKAKWVIYQKERLSDLIEDLSKSLNELDRVLPAGSDFLSSICDDEAGELLNRGAISEAAVALLEGVTAKLDKQLGDAIARRRAPTSSGATVHNYHNVRGVNVGATLTGDQTNTLNFSWIQICRRGERWKQMTAVWAFQIIRARCFDEEGWHSVYISLEFAEQKQ